MPTILTALGAGSGIDTTALIDQLVAADKASRGASLTRQRTDADARISAMAQVRSAIAAVSTSLDTRVRQAALGVQVGSSSTAVGIEALGNGPVAPFDADLRIDQLAGFQTLVAGRLARTAAPVGAGTLTLTLGTRTALAAGGFGFAPGAVTPVTIAIGTGQNSLAGLRDAINAAGTPVRASIVADAQGATLVLKGATGAASAFTLTATPDAAGPGLERFDYRPEAATLTLGTDARDALVNIDGVDVRRGSNVIDDLVGGARLRLNGVAATPIAIAGRRDESVAASTLTDLAAALSSLRLLVSDFRRSGDGTTAAGALAGDAGATAIDKRLVALISTPAVAGGLTLRDCGLSVARDGSIGFSASRLTTVSETRAGEVAGLLKGLTSASVPGGKPLLAGLTDLAGASAAGFEQRKTALARQSTALDARMATYRATLVNQYAAMERAVAASKSTGTFLDQQIKAWNARSN